MRACLLVLLLSLPAWSGEPPSPFPFPSPDDKAIAAGADQRSFRVPFRFARVEQFYRERFGNDAQVTLTATLAEGHHVLTLKSRRSGDAWARAVIREGEVDTTVEVTPVLRAGEERVEGAGRPTVEMVLTRSREFDKMVESIDHAPAAQKP